ncbi:hypothetical protein O181_066750 [Austropuccinia psidii MF-1]|uniref:Uncharacterized protein n=1 Tax=Austropuccinia psidii MF-1 TaxID=1389203 RepID=A0A9Q3I5E5_9BASI|nr:hypothetical protein [Austropuccinia psidii MF-1]
MNYLSIARQTKCSKAVYGYITIFFLLAFLVSNCQAGGKCGIGGCQAIGKHNNRPQWIYRCPCERIYAGTHVKETSPPFKTMQCAACLETTDHERERLATRWAIRCDEHRYDRPDHPNAPAHLKRTDSAAAHPPAANEGDSGPDAPAAAEGSNHPGPNVDLSLNSGWYR